MVKKQKKNSSKLLKIGFVFDDSLDKGDGVQQYILALGAYFSSQGHDIHYIVGETARTDITNLHSMSKNIRVSFNGNKMSMPLPASKKRIRSLLEREKFDVLHVQMPHSPFMAQRVILAAPKQTRIVGTFHILPNSALVTLANKGLGQLLTKSFKRIDAVVSVSPAAQKFLLKNWKLRSEVLSNVVDVTRFSAAKALPKLEESINIMFLGRLVERKGCRHLLDAVKLIVRLNLTDKPFKVVICGKGPLRSSLQDFVSLNGLKHIVEFVGFIKENEKPSYLASADIAAFPASGGESFGIVLIEAMAASRGVVLGGDNPGYRSVLGSHDEQLFAPKDTHELALLLAKYINDSKLRTIAHEWQVNDVVQYDIPQVADKLLKLYKKSK